MHTKFKLYLSILFLCFSFINISYSQNTILPATFECKDEILFVNKIDKGYLVLASNDFKSKLFVLNDSLKVNNEVSFDLTIYNQQSVKGLYLNNDSTVSFFINLGLSNSLEYIISLKTQKLSTKEFDINEFSSKMVLINQLPNKLITVEPYKKKYVLISTIENHSIQTDTFKLEMFLKQEKISNVKKLFRFDEFSFNTTYVPNKENIHLNQAMGHNKLYYDIKNNKVELVSLYGNYDTYILTFNLNELLFDTYKNSYNKYNKIIENEALIVKRNACLYENKLYNIYGLNSRLLDIVITEIEKDSITTVFNLDFKSQTIEFKNSSLKKFESEQKNLRIIDIEAEKIESKKEVKSFLNDIFNQDLYLTVNKSLNDSLMFLKIGLVNYYQIGGAGGMRPMAGGGMMMTGGGGGKTFYVFKYFDICFNQFTNKKLKHVNENTFSANVDSLNQNIWQYSLYQNFWGIPKHAVESFDYYNFPQNNYFIKYRDHKKEISYLKKVN